MAANKQSLATSIVKLIRDINKYTDNLKDWGDEHMIEELKYQIDRDQLKSIKTDLVNATRGLFWIGIRTNLIDLDL